MKMSAQFCIANKPPKFLTCDYQKGSSAYQLHKETLSKHHMGSQPCTIQDQYESFSQPEWKEETQSCILLWFPMREESCLFHYPALSHPRGRSARRYLDLCGPSPARSRLWTASPPPWPAACTGVRLASHHTPTSSQSVVPGQCCTSGGASGQLWDLARRYRGEEEVTMATGQEGGGPSAGEASQGSQCGHHLCFSVSNATTPKGCQSHCRSIYLLQQRSSSFP